VPCLARVEKAPNALQRLIRAQALRLVEQEDAVDVALFGTDHDRKDGSR
jgi:hypothetical protein